MRKMKCFTCGAVSDWDASKPECHLPSAGCDWAEVWPSPTVELNPAYIPPIDWKATYAQEKGLPL